MGTVKTLSAQVTPSQETQRNLKSLEEAADHLATAETANQETQRNPRSLENHLKKDSSNSDSEEAEEAPDHLATVETANQETQRDPNPETAAQEAQNPRNELPQSVTLVSI